MSDSDRDGRFKRPLCMIEMHDVMLETSCWHAHVCSSLLSTFAGRCSRLHVLPLPLSFHFALFFFKFTYCISVFSLHPGCCPYHPRQHCGMRQQVRPAGRRWRSPGTYISCEILNGHFLSIVDTVAYSAYFLYVFVHAHRPTCSTSGVMTT